MNDVNNNINNISKNSSSIVIAGNDAPTVISVSDGGDIDADANTVSNGFVVNKANVRLWMAASGIARTAMVDATGFRN